MKLNNKTILWLFNEFYNPEAGGIERATSLVLKGLKAKGYNCLGVLVIDSQNKIYLNNTVIQSLPVFLKNNHVDIVINQISQSVQLLDRFLINGGEEWKIKGGMIISCLHFNPKMLSLRFHYQCMKNKTWFDWMNYIKLTVLNPYYKQRQERKQGRIYQDILNKSDYIVVLSKTYIPYLKRIMHLKSDDKLVAIGNTLTFDEISDISILEEKKNVCLIVGRMYEYHKRITLALKAWKRIQDTIVSNGWILKIVGDGPSLEDYKNFVKKNHISNVVFLGHQSPEYYYREAKIYLMTSSTEGWPLVITESMQRGVVPLIMNCSSVFEEIIENGKNGFLTPNSNVKLFCKKLTQLMNNEDLLRTASKNALISVEKYQLDKVIKKWEDLLI